MRSCVARLCRTAMDGADIKRVVSLLYGVDAWRFAGEVAIIDRMSLLRFVAVVALALWVGGLVALGVAAPTLFQVLEQHAPNGRELAGAAFGDVFARFQHVAWGLGTALLASIGARAALGPRPRRTGIRIWIAATMLALSLASALYIAPRIERIRASVPGPVASLPATDARRVEFGRLHGASNALMVATIVFGLGLLWFETRDTH